MFAGESNAALKICLMFVGYAFVGFPKCEAVKHSSSLLRSSLYSPPSPMTIPLMYMLHRTASSCFSSPLSAMTTAPNSHQFTRLPPLRSTHRGCGRRRVGMAQRGRAVYWPRHGWTESQIISKRSIILESICQ